MGMSNPTSRLLTYKINHEVGATIDIVEIDGANYIQLLSKEGTLLSQVPFEGGSSGTTAPITSIKVNGTTLSITNKTVDITVPTKTSDLTNDSDYLVASNLIAGENISLAQDGDVITISSTASGSGSLQAELTTSVAVGAIEAGTTFPVGTSLEDIIRQMLYIPTYDWYVGFTTGMTNGDSKTAADSVLESYILESLNKDTTSYSFTPTEEQIKGMFFVLLKDGISPSSAKLVPQGIDSFASNWSAADIEDQLLIVNDGVTRTVTINNIVYTMYGYFNSTWSSASESSTGIADVFTFNIAA